MRQLNDYIQPMKKEVITLGAGAIVRKSLLCRSFRVTEVTGDIEIGFNDLQSWTASVGDAFDLPEGDFTETINLRETSGANPASITIRYSSARVENGAVVIDGSVRITEGAAMTTPANVTAGSTATLLSALNTDRNTILLQNQSTTENLWIGDTNVGNDASPRGLKLGPGDSYETRSRAAFYGRRGGAVDVSVGILEIET